MYAPRGYGLSEVGDVEVFPTSDKLHLFHLTLPNHDIVQHAVSDDGLAWRALPHALRVGDPGECDDDMIWTMAVIERNGTYHMTYTALARAEDGLVQRMALAISSDLINWTKDERNPVAEADPRWYEASLSAIGRVSWRDPKPIRVGDTYYVAITAREREGPLMRRGCVGLLASSDLRTWEVRPPLFAPRRHWEIEAPQVFKIDDAFYITASIMEDRLQHYWTASRFEGPYEVPPDGGILSPVGHYSGRVCRWQGLDLLWGWHATAYDWPGFRNPFGKFLIPPLVLWRRPDGSLGRRSFPSWEAYQESAPAAPGRMLGSLLRNRAADTDDAWRVVAHDGMDVQTTESEATNFWFEGELTLDAPVGGLGFRLDDQGGGYFVHLVCGQAEVSLRKFLPGPYRMEYQGGSLGPDGVRRFFKHVELQRGRLPAAITRGRPISFRLIVNGPYIECSLGNEVVLATASAERTTGRIGIWAESGTAGATNVLLAPMRTPRHA